MKKLSDPQQVIFEYMVAFAEEHGYPPSVREICEAVNLKSTSTVHGHLEQLEKRGLIRRDSTKPRAMEVLDNPLSKGRSVPLVGRVTAGIPILAEENIEDYIVLPQDLVGSDDELFALRVRGESMIRAGILNGDFIIVRKQSHADNGDIVVAMIEDEATVKRIFFERDGVRLQPENPYYDPIYSRKVTVVGKVTALFRKL